MTDENVTWEPTAGLPPDPHLVRRLEGFGWGLFLTWIGIALLLNLERMTATWQDRLVDLTVTEFWITHCLARHPGHVKNRQQLMDAANAVLDDNSVTSHIKRIRRKFQQVDQDFAAIETAYGAGYRWRA
mgnify:CR=1 FL=1